MSKVSNNLVVSGTGDVKSYQKLKTPTFKGKGCGDYYKSQKKLMDELSKSFPKTVQMLKKMQKFTGEASIIIINAIGTAFVAPIFIAFNPLSKTDEDTKKYSALRQPVSAVLAVLTQAGLVIPLDRFLENKTNEGALGDNLDKRAFQDESYLRRKFKKENPKKSAKEIQAMVDDELSNQYKNLYASIEDNGAIIIDSKTGKKVSTNSFYELLSETIDKEEKSLKKANVEGLENKLKNINDIKKMITNKKSTTEIITNMNNSLRNGGEGADNIIHSIIDNYTSKVSKSVKGFKAITGLVVSLAILPVTCYALNWLYPRFMEKCFPKLANAKKNTLKNMSKGCVSEKNPNLAEKGIKSDTDNFKNKVENLQNVKGGKNESR